MMWSDEETDIRVGGYGPDGCTCTITTLDQCPVHAICPECAKPLNGELTADGRDGLTHYRCFLRAKAHGRQVDRPEPEKG